MQWTEVGVGCLGEVSTSKPGTYTRATVTRMQRVMLQRRLRTVNVVDTIAPVITLNGDANITHEAGFVYLDANASWADVVDGSGTLPRLASQCK